MALWECSSERRFFINKVQDSVENFPQSPELYDSFLFQNPSALLAFHRVLRNWFKVCLPCPAFRYSQAVHSGSLRFFFPILSDSTGFVEKQPGILSISRRKVHLFCM